MRWRVSLLLGLLLWNLVSVGGAESQCWSVDDVLEARARLSQLRVIRGMGRTPEMLAEPITRAEAAVFIARGLGREGQEGGTPPFHDMAGHWAAAHVADLAAESIVRGDPGGGFQPDQRLTAAQAHLMVTRLLRVPATLETAGDALAKAGLETPADCAGGGQVSAGAFFLLLDAALSTPLYARHASGEWREPSPLYPDEQVVLALGRLQATGVAPRDDLYDHIDYPPYLTRAEFATVLVRALGRADEAGVRSLEPPFSDLNGHWAARHIALLQEEGIVRGYPGGQFRPNDPVRGDEARLMLARLLRVPATLETASEALRQAGVDDRNLYGETADLFSRPAIWLLLDRALSVPLSARLLNDPAQGE